jgi:hypothetical protein
MTIVVEGFSLSGDASALGVKIMKICGLDHALWVAVERTTNSDGVTQYHWDIELVFGDATGTRKLGYRGSGIKKSDSSMPQFEREPEVHDQNKFDRWTVMPLTHRPDVRKRMIDLVTRAIRSLNKSGEKSYNHVVPHKSI